MHVAFPSRFFRFFREFFYLLEISATWLARAVLVSLIVSSIEKALSFEDSGWPTKIPEGFFNPPEIRQAAYKPIKTIPQTTGTLRIIMFERKGVFQAPTQCHHHVFIEDCWSVGPHCIPLVVGKNHATTTPKAARPPVAFFQTLESYRREETIRIPPDQLSGN